MNTPNKLTILRIVMAPLFLVFMLWDTLPFHYLIAMALFIAASVTDLLDGKIARKRNLITNFGKLLDPLADKMLVTAALLGMLSEGICGVWIPMIILTREFLVTSLRLVAAGEGNVIAASMWGKVKTVSQMLVIILVLFFEQIKVFSGPGLALALSVTSQILLWGTALITLISGVHYMWVNRSYVDHRK